MLVGYKARGLTQHGATINGREPHKSVSDVLFNQIHSDSYVSYWAFTASVIRLGKYFRECSNIWLLNVVALARW